jgi:hypothetical protein
VNLSDIHERRTGHGLIALILTTLVIGFGLLTVEGARADSAPVGPLPQGSIATTTTTPGLLVAVALPHAQRSSGLVWRIARRYDSRIVRQVSEADVRGSVVLIFEVIGRGDTSLVFALTRGDASSKALRAATHKIHSV